MLPKATDVASSPVATRFSVTDHTAAERAAAGLHQATREATGRADAALQMLTRIEPTDTPAEVLTALAQWRRRLRSVERGEAHLLLLLHECGASVRGLADALKMHRSTVSARIEAARAERDAAEGR